MMTWWWWKKNFIDYSPKSHFHSENAVWRYTGDPLFIPPPAVLSHWSNKSRILPPKCVSSQSCIAKSFLAVPMICWSISSFVRNLGPFMCPCYVFLTACSFPRCFTTMLLPTWHNKIRQIQMLCRCTSMLLKNTGRWNEGTRGVINCLCEWGKCFLTSLKTLTCGAVHEN